MGKRITLYLTDTELGMIETLCARDGVGPNMSKTLKQGLLKMFESCLSLGGPTHEVPHEPRFITKQAAIEGIKDEDLAKHGLKKAKCPRCGTLNVVPLDAKFDVESPSEKKSILKKLSEKDQKELEKLGVRVE